MKNFVSDERIKAAADLIRQLADHIENYHFPLNSIEIKIENGIKKTSVPDLPTLDGSKIITIEINTKDPDPSGFLLGSLGKPF